jgi:hypothetical protein
MRLVIAVLVCAWIYVKQGTLTGTLTLEREQGKK